MITLLLLLPLVIELAKDKFILYISEKVKKDILF